MSTDRIKRNPKKARARRQRETMRREYDFTGGVRGKYAARFAKESVSVLLDPDVAEMFPDAASVNETLRAIDAIIRQRARRKGPSRTSR